MTPKSKVLICALLIAAAGLSAAPPPEEAAALPRAPSLETQVERLNETMAGIASMLDELLRRQQADLLMKRIQLATRGLTDLENRVAGAREEIESLTSARDRLTEEISRVEAALDDEEEPQPGMPDTSEGRREMKSQMERELRFVSDRLSTAENRVIDLENQLAVRLDDLAAWEELVDKALGLR